MNSTSAPSSEKLPGMALQSNLRSGRYRWAALVLLAGWLTSLSVRAEGDVARVRAATALLDDSVQGSLPATVTLPRELGEEQAMRVTEFRYCGASDKGNGKFRAAGRVSGGEAAPRPLLVGAEACRANLIELAERAGAALAEGTVLVDLEAAWRSWELKLAAVRAVRVDKEGRARPVAGLGKPFELQAMRTSDLRIDNGAGPPIVLHARPVFHANAIEILLVLADKTPGKLPLPDAAELALSGPENIAAVLPAAFANQVLRRLTWTQPLVIPVDRDEVEVRDVTLIGEGAGEAAQLMVAGSATPRSVRETVRWQVLSTGEPLRLSVLRAAAQPEDCAGLGTMAAIGCNLRNGARVAGAEAFVQALTQKHQGRFVHELGNPFDLHFTVAGQRIGLRGELLRTAWSSRGLSATARLGTR